MASKKQTEQSAEAKKRKPAIKQSDVPSMSLEQALRVPQAIADNYALKPTTPLNVAAAMDMQPSSGPFRMICGAAVAYGLTEGGYNAQTIEVAPLGRRIVRTTVDGDDLLAKREAILKPRVIGEFLRKYDNSPIAKESIAINVLEELAVPRERAPEVFELIKESASSLGLIKTIKDRSYVDLAGVSPPTAEEHEAEEQELSDPTLLSDESEDDEAVATTLAPTIDARSDARRKRVFITHGKNRSFLDPIKKLLAFGEMEPVVSVDQQTVSKPVPDKVLADMRGCGAAIIHVDADRVLMDSEAKEHILLNENVLIEIGAAMALYGRRFILLVKDGVRLPSNLQGLYEVRYEGDQLDGNATIKLLEAINDIKNNPLPTEVPSATA